MKIFRIYKINVYPAYNGYLDDYDDIEEDETIKYVDSKEKVDEFFKSIEDKNRIARKCYECPIVNLTKRQYGNGKHINEINYCSEKEIRFNGNKVLCSNEKYSDFTEYYVEEIEVE